MAFNSVLALTESRSGFPVALRIVEMMNRKIGAAGALSALGLVLAAQVQADVPVAVTTAITDAGTDIATIGAAVLGLAVVAMTFRWLKATFF